MEVNLFDYTEEIFKMTETNGVLVVSIDKQGMPNIMTIGWLLLGMHYYKKPVAVIALLPDRHTFKLLDEVEEFVIAVPKPEHKEAVTFCGEKSGRDVDKFKETGFTQLPSVHIKPPSIKECTLNIECRIYHKVDPPQHILKPEWVDCTVYFAEVLGVYKY